MLCYATLHYANHTILQVLTIFFKAVFLARHPIPPLNAKGIALPYCWGKIPPSSLTIIKTQPLSSASHDIPIITQA